MADHSAIVALREILRPYFHDHITVEAADEAARAAYAAVLRDLMEPSEAMWRAAAKEIPGYDYPFVYKGLKEAIKARAREIGVEI